MGFQSNSNDADGGVLTGRWTETYPKSSTEPWAWGGSVAILEEFMKSRRAVQFGQCWVFSGLVTTRKSSNNTAVVVTSRVSRATTLSSLSPHVSRATTRPALMSPRVSRATTLPSLMSPRVSRATTRPSLSPRVSRATRRPSLLRHA